MKLVTKISLLVFTVLVANTNIVNETITSIDIQEAKTSFTFHNIATIVFNDIENDLANCCQNKQGSVDYNEWGISVEVVAAKGGQTITGE